LRPQPHHPLEFDANLMRLAPEVEQWVEGLREIDRCLEDQARENPPTEVWEGVDRIERELTALRRSFCAEPATGG
jgi:HPt (histidine-containing phosphotransfer) domain-containing protein